MKRINELEEENKLLRAKNSYLEHKNKSMRDINGLLEEKIRLLEKDIKFYEDLILAPLKLD
jgi:hypothetical protein